MEKVRVLVVEDEFVTGVEIQSRLEDSGYDAPVVVDTGEEAIQKVIDLRPQIVIMDITLKGKMTGIEAAEIIRHQYETPVIYLTAHSDDATIEKAVTTEPFGYLIKPLDDRALQTAIRMALYKHTLDLALKESEKKYRAIAELAEDSIYIINQDHSVAFLNQYGFRFFHCPQESSDNMDLSRLFPDELKDPITSHVDTVISSGKSLRVTLTGTIYGYLTWIDTTLVPVIAESGVVTQVIGLSRDITAMVLLEKEMEKKGIQQLEQNMEQFQILNDKIRNPLSIIISIASLEESKESAAIIEQAKIIDDLVTQLDIGWVRSTTVRSFLLKHYGHGREI